MQEPQPQLRTTSCVKTSARPSDPPNKGSDMTDPDKPREAEAMAVTLGRIDIKVGNILDVIKEVRTELVQHRGKIGALELAMQQVQSDQAAAAKDLKAADKAREDTAAALEKQNALALVKAKDAVEAEGRQTAALDTKTRSTWASRNFGVALLGLIVAALAVYIAFRAGGAVAPPPVR